MMGPKPDTSPTIRNKSQPMRVLIFEPNPSGHRFQYAETVIRAVSEFTTDIVFATTGEATQTAAFREYIEPLLDLIQLDTSAVPPPASPLREAIRKTAAFHRAVKKHQPDQIYVPTADGFVQLLGISNLLGFRSVKQEMELEILLMGGHRYFQSNHWKLKLSRRLWMAALRASGATVIHVLDPWLREKIASSSKSPSFSAKLHDIPEPVESINVTNQDEALRQLGISPHGRTLGFFGAVNRRKGADLLLRAFAESRLAPNDKLLLMGKIDKPIRDLLNEECAELLASGKIILFDRFVSQEELQLGLSAVDVVCAPYPHHPGSSGFVVRAASVKKYLLATDFGWIGKMVNRFDLGKTCNVRDTKEFSTAISEALDQSQQYQQGSKSEEFVRYHTVQNTQSHWTKRLRERLGMRSEKQNVIELP